MTRYAGEINRHIANPSLASDEEWQRITTALDTVAQQKNSYLSGLYWHTDIESAKRAAAASGKPILSLRLLGKLTDEFSCANSRFFRTVLYSNTEVSTVCAIVLCCTGNQCGRCRRSRSISAMDASSSVR